jgi:hypothetical protein
MNYCPSCGKTIEIDRLSLNLLQSFFIGVVTAGKYGLYLLCDPCGERLLKNYRDINGIGV